MKFFIFFFIILLVNTESFIFDGFGKRIQLPEAEFIKLIGEIEENGGFKSAIITEYKSNFVQSIDNTNVLVAFEKIYHHLETLKKMFINAVIKYISKYLISFCTEVINFIDQMKYKENITQEIIDDIKVAQDHGYCVIKFLYNNEADVRMILQVMIFLETYFKGEILEPKFVYLRRELINYTNLLTEIDNPENLNNNNANSINKNWYSTPKIDSFNTIFKIKRHDPQPQLSRIVRLGNLKNIFTEFANKFCVSTVPKVMDIKHYLEYEYEHYKYPIVNYTFENESCEVTVCIFRRKILRL